MNTDPEIHPLDGSEFDPILTLKETHELSRRRFWQECVLKYGEIGQADLGLAEFDKRFPESIPQMFAIRSQQEAE